MLEHQNNTKFLEEKNASLVLLAGYKQILPSAFSHSHVLKEQTGPHVTQTTLALLLFSPSSFIFLCSMRKKSKVLMAFAMALTV